MADKKPTTIEAYIRAAPEAGWGHLRRVDAILREVAPGAERVMKWNTPFFVEPRFLFAFSAHKAHLGFTVNAAGMEPFRDELAGYEVTKAGILKIKYADPLPEDLIRRIAEERRRVVSARADDSFW